MNYSNHILGYSNKYNYICLPKEGSQPSKERLVVHKSERI